jgi:hypothetical protein
MQKSAKKKKKCFVIAIYLKMEELVPQNKKYNIKQISKAVQIKLFKVNIFLSLS